MLVSIARNGEVITRKYPTVPISLKGLIHLKLVSRIMPTQELVALTLLLCSVLF